MGPYCNFCNRRCFVYLPEHLTEEQARIYQERGTTIIATCAQGQAFEKERLGMAYSDFWEKCPTCYTPIPKGTICMDCFERVGQELSSVEVA